MHGHLLQDIGLCILSATVLAYVAKLARQPLILAYIVAGVLIGPVGFKWINDRATIQTLSELGLVFLLFIVGLEIDVKKLVSSGRASTITTVAQVAGSAALGWLAARLLGFDGLTAAYVGSAIAFSSTMIVVKLLADRSELDTVAGRLTLAILLIQDVLAIVVLAVQPNLGGSAAGSPWAMMALSVLKGLGLTAAALLASRFLLPPLFRAVARSPEILLISAVSWCLLVSYGALEAGLSTAMGALIAGVSISTFPYSLDVVAKIRSLRDFFVTLFFVSLGMLLTVPSGKIILATAVLSLLVVASRFLTILPALRLLRYDNRVGILSSIHLGQISEFALVIALLGVNYKHVGSDLVTLVVLTLVVTSTLSTYLIQFSHPIAQVLMRLVSRTPLEDRQTHDTRHERVAPAPIVLVGCFQVASSLIHSLLEAGKDFLVIDFNPDVHRALKKLKVKCIYGDVSHLDTLEHAGIEHARIIVSSIPDDFLRGTDNKTLLGILRRLNATAKIIVTADSIPRALELYAAGADYVLLPRVLVSTQLAEILERVELGDIETLKGAHLDHLRERKEVIA